MSAQIHLRDRGAVMIHIKYDVPEVELARDTTIMIHIIHNPNYRGRTTVDIVQEVGSRK